MLPEYQISIRVPVSSFLFKVFVNEFRKQRQEVNPEQEEVKWLVDDQTYSGRVLLGLISVKPTQINTTEAKERVIELVLPSSYLRKYNISRITEDQVNFFFQSVEKQYREKMFAFIQGKLLMSEELRVYLKRKNFNYKKNGIQIKLKEIMLQFCSKYSIEDAEINYEALLREYSRSFLFDLKKSKSIN